MKRLTKLLVLLIAVIAVFAATAIFASATDQKIGVGIVDASGLRLRSSADMDSTVISTAANGDKVVVLADYGDWYFVNYNLNVGYMKADYLQFLDKENVSLGYGRVNTNVNFRTSPDASGEVITQLAPDTKVSIIGLNCGWYKVTYNDSTGYIRSDLVDLTEVPYYNTNTGSIYDSSSSTGSESSSAAGSESTSAASSESSSSASSESSSAASVESVTYSSAGEQVVAFAKTLSGIPYVWGGTSTGGFDCSGFVQYVYRQFGVSLNRTANAQMSNGYSVSSSELIPGDVVFFSGTYSTSGASHVGIYIGGGQFIHASSGRGCVTISDLWSSYYSAHYYGACRIM
ncbi:MAG: NlpC/P60 family protein [Oscillospiraceae bacterium]|nr:NlpC/P60 family protein [Oscillospiraceae bacterium]